MRITNKKILITGATGYIGGMLVKEFCNDNDVSVIIRNVSYKDKFSPKVNVYVMDINDENAVLSIDDSYNYIIHCASPTKSVFMMTNPSITYNTITNGTENILKLAENLKVESMVYLSSMEVYGVVDRQHRIKEEELGFVDESNPRSCYPLGKRKAEELCKKYFYEQGVPVKIARLAQTFGRGVLADDNRVFMSFAKSVLSNEDIILYTKGDSMGNYCDIEDAIEAIKLLLIKGVSGEAYNIVNEATTMTIREMAELVADKIANRSIKVRIEEKDLSVTGYAPDTGLRLSGEKICALGWSPTKDLAQIYEEVLMDIVI